ncbi:MAG: TatD family hydrolase [Dehalococcoidia bacterium]
MKLIDSHAHLDLVADLPGALEQARQAGVVGIVAQGRDRRSGEHALGLASRYPGFVFPALGMHPYRLASSSLVSRLEAELCFVEENLHRAVALGEVGLDYFYHDGDERRELQQQVFRRLCRRAARLDKPVLVHCWEAWEDCLEIMQGEGVERASFHWFSGTPQVLQEVLGRGYLVSANPALATEELPRQAAVQSPLSRLLLETDAPAEYDSWGTSQPADVSRVAGLAAMLRGQETTQIARATTANAVSFLGISPPGPLP